MEQNEQQPAADAGDPSERLPLGDLPPEARFAEAMLPEAAPPGVESPFDESTGDSPLTESSGESFLPAGSARNQGYIRRIVGATLNYGLGMSLPKVVRFILIMTVFTKILNLKDWGLIELANCFAAFLMTPMRMGVTGAVTRFYYDYPEGPSLKDYVTTVAWFILLCSVTVGLTALVIGRWLLGYFIPELPFVPFAILAILSGLLYCNMELQDRLVQAREQSGYAARLNIGRASISIILALVFVVALHWGAAGLISAEVISYGVLAIVAAFYLRPELKGRFRWPMLRSSMAYGTKMLPGDFAGSVTPLVTRGILTVSKSVKATGALSFATKFTQPLMILATAFQTAFIPIYYSMRKESTPAGMQRLAVTTRNVWALAIFGALGVALLGPVVILLLPAEYHAAAPLLPIVVVVFLGTAIHSVFVSEIYYSKQTWWVPIVVYTSAAVNVILSWLLVGRYGAAGVAWGTSARVLVSSTLFAIISLRMVKIPHQWFSLLRITLCGAAAASTLWWIPHDGGFAELGIGALGVLLFPVLLWATGDASIREGMKLLYRQLMKSS